MQVLHINNKMRIYIMYFSLFFTLFASNMVSALVLGTLVKYAFWFWGLFLLFFINGKFSTINLKILCSLLIFRGILILFQLLAGIELTSTTMNSLLGMAFYLNTIIQTAELCSEEEYANAYVNLMTAISVVSLVCFGYLMSPLRETIFSFARVDGQYIHSYIHLWGWNNNIWRMELFTRNAGPWWEPGAFLVFIMFAMLMILSGRCKNNKKLRIKFIILVITWITIQSTTGYLIMGFVFVMMIRRVMEIIFQRPYNEISQKQKAFLVISGVTFLLVFFVTIGYANITEKFSEQNESSSIRFSDVFGSLEISMEEPLVGLGEDLSPYYEKHNIVNNSAALLVIAMGFGWPYLIFFVLLLLRGIRNFFMPELNLVAFGAWIVILILCMTEGIIELPIMYVFFAQYGRRDENKEG